MCKLFVLILDYRTISTKNDEMDGACSMHIETKKHKILSELLGFWTFSIVWYSREHDVSETGSVSVLR
jgi:hypothetical protein